MRAVSKFLRPSRRTTRFAPMLWVLLSLMASPLSAQQNLPDMGEPADNALSPQQEKQLGVDIMRQIRAQIPLVRDTLLNEYVMNLGTRLASSAASREASHIQFFIIDDPAINAFAIPGGYVAINAGLVQAMQREEQLAGVIAHEVAHLTQRHHARSYASAGKNRMSTAAAVLAAILISASNPEAGQAALAAGLAISQQSAVNYTRMHEYEADRIGIQILANADYDPGAIAETFEILRQRNTLNTSGLEIEYLRTHPLDSNRVAEARSRAAQLPPVTNATDQLDFLLFQARLNVLTSREPDRLEREYQANLKRAQNPEASAYALALLSDLAGKPEAALHTLEPLIRQHSGHLYLRLLEARVRFAVGDNPGSASILEQLLAIYPERYSVVEQAVGQLITQRRLLQASDALKKYQRSAATPDSRVWRELANIQEKLGQRASSHESLARYFDDLNEYSRAEEQLKLALAAVDAGSMDELRLRAQMRETQQKLKAQRQ